MQVHKSKEKTVKE